MLKLGVITDEISMDLDRVIAVMKEHGFREAEIRGIWGKNIADLSIDEVKKAKNLMEKNGINVCAVCSPFFKCTEPGRKEEGSTGPAHGAQERGFDQQMALLDDLIEKSRILGTNIIRAFSFWKKGPLTEEVYKKIIDSYRKPLEVAKKQKMILALENEPSCYLGSGKEVGRAAREINHPNLKVVWDPGNSHSIGEVAYPDGYNAVKDYIVHVHIKDPVRNKATGEVNYTVVGKGDLDFNVQLKELSKHFSGAVSLETHTHLFAKAGSAEQATIECMESLKKIVADIK